MSSYIFHFDSKLMSHESNDAKDDKPSKDTGDTVTNRNHDTISEDVVAELVVAGQSDHTTPGNTKWEENLDTSICPNLQTTTFDKDSFFLFNLH